MGIDVARERGQSAVRHPHRERRCVLKRIWHREEEDLHYDLRELESYLSTGFIGWVHWVLFRRFMGSSVQWAAPV